MKGEPEIGLVKDSLYFFRTNTTNTTGLYNLKNKNLFDIKERHTTIAQQMDSLVNAYYHSTKYLYFNNKKSNK